MGCGGVGRTGFGRIEVGRKILEAIVAVERPECVFWCFDVFGFPKILEV
jgi:hypothetical protein